MLHQYQHPSIVAYPLLNIGEQESGSIEVPLTPITPPPTHGDSLFWTIVAIAILVKAILGASKGTKG